MSPSAELRDHIQTYKRLSQLYAAVRNAYSETGSFLGDLEYKTRRLIQGSAEQEGLGRIAKVVTFDVATLEQLKGDDGPDEGKVYNLLRGPRKEMDDDPAKAVVLRAIKERADQVIKNLEERKVIGMAAMDEIAALVAEKDEAKKAAQASGLSDVGFAVHWQLGRDEALAGAGLDTLAVAREVETLLTKFPTGSRTLTSSAACGSTFTSRSSSYRMSSARLRWSRSCRCLSRPKRTDVFPLPGPATQAPRHGLGASDQSESGARRHRGHA